MTIGEIEIVQVRFAGGQIETRTVAVAVPIEVAVDEWGLPRLDEG